MMLYARSDGVLGNNPRGACARAYYRPRARSALSIMLLIGPCPYARACAGACIPLHILLPIHAPALSARMRPSVGSAGRHCSCARLVTSAAEDAVRAWADMCVRRLVTTRAIRFDSCWISRWRRADET